MKDQISYGHVVSINQQRKENFFFSSMPSCLSCLGYEPTLTEIHSSVNLQLKIDQASQAPCKTFPWAPLLHFQYQNDHLNQPHISLSFSH